MAKSKFNWEEIEHRYVTGHVTYKELAIENKVSEARINTIGGQRKWKKKGKTTVWA